MTAAIDTTRCPRCSALVRPGGQWCTLCYADLRPAPIAEAAPPAPPATPATPATPAFVADTAPRPGSGAPDRESGPRHAAGKHAAEPLHDADEPVAGWPCMRCGASVSIEEGACTSCGAGFMENLAAGDPGVGIGRLRLTTGQVSNQAKVLIMVGGSIGLLVALLGLMYLLGSIF